MGSVEIHRLSETGTPGCGFTAELFSSNPGKGEIGSAGEGLVAPVVRYTDAIVYYDGHQEMGKIFKEKGAWAREGSRLFNRLHQRRPEFEKQVECGGLAVKEGTNNNWIYNCAP